MASLQDIMKQKAAAMALNTPAVASVGIATADIATLDEPAVIPAYSPDEPMVANDGIAAYAGEMLAEENWIRSDKYAWYDEYYDDKYSTVDEKKNITLHPDQINLTQESRSQFMPVLMNRYYDGVDLMTKSLLIRYENKDKKGSFLTPINVEYNETQIRFGILPDEFFTSLSGEVKFEIHAEGSTSKNDKYTFKTRMAKVNVEQALSSSSVVEPSNDWLNSFLVQVTEKVSEASAAANEASAAASRAEESANLALQAAADSQISIDEAKAELATSIDTEVNEKVATALLDYYTKTEVDTLFENFDISSQLTSIEEELDDVKEQISTMDGLAKFDVQYDGTTMTFYNGETVMKEIPINSDPSAEWTQSYTASVDAKIAEAKTEVQGNLDTYKATTDADLQSLHQSIDGLPETLQTDYYNKEATDEKFALKSDLTATNQTVAGMTSSIETNKTSISTLSETVVDLQSEVAGIDKSPRKSYRAAYTDDFRFELRESEDDGETYTVVDAFTITGGSGGGSSSTLKIEYVTKSPLVVTTNDEAKITFNFSGTDSSGDEITEGQATIKVGSSVVASQIVTAGENTIDVTQYLAVGSQKVLLSITDDNDSLATKSWTVQKLDVKIESSFNDKLTYPLEQVAFDYTPYGAISKDVHFVLDGEEIHTVNTQASGVPMGFNIPAQTHGSHLLDVYMTATVNNNTITSNHIVKDILWFDETSKVPVIGCTQTNIKALQYDTTNIEYTVYDPTTETPKVTLAVDGEVVSTLTMEKNTDTWQFKSSEVGNHVLTITCGETVKTINVEVEKLDITIEPVTAGLVVDFNPVGKSNSDADRVWSNGTYKMTVSDNFDWVNGGYQIDANGDQYFCIKAGTNVELDYQMFADDAKRNGKEMKLIFKTTNVQQAHAKFMSCVDNTTGSDHIGIEMFAHEAFIYGSADKLHLKYSENDIIEFEFNITKNTEAVARITGFEDGCSSRHLVYDDTFNFTQNTPKTITLGSDKCDLHIYRLKIYNTSLTDRGVLSNFIADARNAQDMIDRYNRNQIYDENSQLTPESLAEACPWLRVYVVSAPYFTKKKSDKVPYATIRQIYKNGDPILGNWVCYDASFSGQGTSSDNYGGAARNLDFIMNKSNQEDKTVKPYFILGDGTTRATEVSLSRTSIPNAYYNFKANVASSNHFTNALLAMKYNKFNPYKRPFVREDASIIPYIRDTMEFYNAVVFIQETNEDLSTHREFADCDIHFYSIGNICDSKKTDVSRLTDPSDIYECIVEIMDVDLPLSEWPVDTMINAMGYKKDDTTGEIIYTWAKDENLGILYELIDGEYVLTTDETVDLSKTYYVDVLENDDFSEDFTYGWRYIWEDGTDEENAEVFKRSRDAWINFYRFVTTSTDEEFKAHFDEYFVKDSAIYYYLFTERFCMVDSRCKNTFWHLGKTGTYRALSKPVKELLHLYCESTDSGYIPTTDTEIDPSKTYYTQYAFDLAFDYDNDKNC